MTTSTHIKRRLATLAVIAGAMSMFAPIASASSDIVRSPDAIDREVKAHQTEIYANVDAREHPVLSPSRTSSPAPDVVERTAAAGSARYLSQPTPSSGFDWSDFGIGAGVGIGLVLLLGGVGAALFTWRGREQVKTA